MNTGGDSLTTLRWALRRYIWIIISCVLAGAVLVPLGLRQAADVYESNAQIGPTEELVLSNVDLLPRLGESLFTNGAVSEAVQSALGLSSEATVIPSRVELEAPEDNIVFVVTGRGSDAETARRVADVAAAALLGELSNYAEAVGEFAIQRSAESPLQPEPTLSQPLSAAFGGLGGGLLGVGLVVLWLAWRRPIIDRSDAAAVMGVPVLGRVAQSRGGVGHDSEGVAPLCRRLLASGSRTIFLVSDDGLAGKRQMLARAISSVLENAERSDRHSEDSSVSAKADVGTVTGTANQANVQILEAPTAAEIVTRSDKSLLVLLIGVGASMASARRLAEGHLDDGPAGLVLVGRG